VTILDDDLDARATMDLTPAGWEKLQQPELDPLSLLLVEDNVGVNHQQPNHQAILADD
jgi:hypothetical protein